MSRHDKIFRAADLFCGAGGTSQGLALACEESQIEVDLLAVNHWSVAVETHQRNHPWARHLCKSLQEVNPKEAVPGGRLNLLIAAPECTHHSVARGGRPILDQMRMSAWHVIDWISALYVDSVLIENVREFRDWGPLGVNGRPIKSKRGETYKAFVGAIKSLGYRVEERILNAADYGDPTTRQRLFIIGRRASKKIIWPKATHCQSGLLGKKWRSAREIIDWQIKGQSIFERKRPLSPNTMARIFAGLKLGGVSFVLPPLGYYQRNGKANKPRSVEEPLQTITASHGGGHVVEPYLVHLRGTQKSHLKSKSIDKPVPTLTTSMNVGVVEPFILPHRMFDRMDVDSIEKPLRTVTATNGSCHALVEPTLEPFLISAGGPVMPARSIDKPVNTILTREHIAVVKPFLVPFFGERKGQKPRTHSVDEPTPAVTSHGAGGLVEPYLVAYRGNHAGKTDGLRRTHAIDRPLPTQDCSNRYALAEPFLVSVNHGDGNARRTSSIEVPVPTLTTKRGLGIVESFIVNFHGNGITHSVDEPLRTVATRNQFGLIQYPLVEVGGVLYVLDILFRMLKPHELAAAMGFPKSYKFVGTVENQVRQIGNAVAVNTAKALCLGVLRN